MVSKNISIRARWTLKKNLKRQWLEEKANIFVYEGFTLFTDLPKWILCYRGREIESGEYGGNVMSAIKRKIVEQGVKL